MLHITNLYPTKQCRFKRFVQYIFILLSCPMISAIVLFIYCQWYPASSVPTWHRMGHSAGDFRRGIRDTASVPHSSSQMSCIAASVQWLSQLGHSQPSSLSRPVSWFLVARIIAPFCGVLCQETFCICLAIHTEDVKECSSSLCDTTC